jgi:restriction endonuclease S subunit
MHGILQVLSGSCSETEVSEQLYLRITDLNDDGSINFKNDKKFITPTGETKQQFLLKNNDIVIARSGSIGKSAIYKSAKYEDMIFASYLIRLQVDKNKILPDYLFNFTKTQIYWNQVEINGIAVAQPNLNAEKIKEFQIPLPPLGIQQRIVSEIEILEKKEAEAKEKIEGLREKIDGIIKTKFLHERKLGDIISLEYGVALPEKDRIKGSYPVVGSNGIAGWHNDFLIEAPVIVVGRKGSAGKINWIDKNCTPIDTTFFVRVKDARYALKILYYAIKNLNLESLAGGTGVPGLNRNDAYAKNINVPPLPEQQKIAAEIEKIEARIAEAQITLDAMPEHKNAVLQKYL